jgi:hypothetical protein
MRRLAFALLAVVTIALAALLSTRRDDPGPAPARPTLWTAPAAPAPATPREVALQRDVDPAVAEDLARRRLLNVARTEAWEARGLRILAGPAPSSPDAPQEMWVTPIARGPLTVGEITGRLRRICRELRDRCQASDYRLLLETSAGTVPLPNPTTKDQR